MVEQFKQKYLEEVNDLLNELEGTMLQLEQQPESQDGVNEVFRVMHTIKGTSGMYDFKTVEKITHNIENIYGKIRDSHGSVSKQVSAITLEGIDLVRRLLNKPSSEDDILVENFLEKLGGESSQKQNEIAAPEGEHTFYILFTPEADVAGRGINIKNILDDASALGDSVVIPRSWPDDEKYANKFYMYWEIVVGTQKTLAEVEEIFLFVADEVKITTISQGNMMLQPQFVAKIEQLQSTECDIDVEQLMTFAAALAPQQDEALPSSLPSKVEIKDDKQENEDKIINRSVGMLDRKTTSIKVDSDKLDELMNLVSELITTKAEMIIVAEKYNIPDFSRLTEKIDKLSNKFKDNALSIRLIPIESMMLRFERLVRDLSHELGKEIDFITEGTDTELDKTIIDNLAVPLMHIIRNSVDHGIESIERRRELKKTDRGKIKFTAFYSGANVFIQVQDDGAGMDPEKLRQKAIEKGFIRPEDKLTTRQIYDLVFYPGFSTAQKITGISGRGVGMDVVKQNIVNLRGEIEMDSEVNLGTITTIKLPLTLSIVDALLVSISSNLFLIPLYVIDSCTQVDAKIIDTDNHRFVYENVPTPFINLRHEFEILGDSPSTINIILVKYKDTRVGLTVDKVIGEHQAVLKSLGRYFADQEYISGGSILGDGRIALVLDTNKLIRQLE